MFDKLKGSMRGAPKSSRTTGRGLSIMNILHVFYRFIQIVMACVVIGYYAQDLRAAHKEDKYSDSKWVSLTTSRGPHWTWMLIARQVYAVVVGSLAAISALILGILGILSSFHVVSFFFPWEWILVILWAALAGIFGSMYRTANSALQPGIQRMKTAFYFDWQVHTQLIASSKLTT